VGRVGREGERAKGGDWTAANYRDGRWV